jgi:hypothetical protein
MAQSISSKPAPSLEEERRASQARLAEMQRRLRRNAEIARSRIREFRLRQRTAKALSLGC